MPGKAAGHRLRRGRYSEPGRIYAVTVVCHQRRSLFSELAAGRRVVQALWQVEAQASTLCYVVMPDHVHWLLQLADGAELSRAVQAMKAHCSRRLHRDGVAGRVWQRGFHDRALRAEDDVRAAARYIVANPLRAGLVASVREYGLWDAIWLDG